MGRAARELGRLRWGAALACLLAWPAWGQGMFEGRAIVTGMDGRSRPAGVRAGLREVLARVAGDPALLRDPRVEALDADGMLQSFAYVDRMGHLPRGDEQGSRDRPYDLHTHWDPAAVGDALRFLGRAPWPVAERPVVAVRVRVEPRVGEPFTLAPDTDGDERHRAALLAAGTRFGLVLRIEPGAGDAGPGTALLDGTVRWRDGEGWRAEWALDWEGRGRAWDVSGVSFDEAYRNGVGEAAGQMATYWLNR